MTLRNKDLPYSELNRVMQERSEKILKRFSQKATSKVTDPKLLAVLEDIKDYWGVSHSFAQFRPALTSLSCEAVGGNPEQAETAAVIFTLAAAGFGTHDDILDKSPNKHLKMTILGLHGIDSALLVGDLLIVKAWSMFHEMIRKTGNTSRISDIIEVYGNLSIEICEAELMETTCRRKVATDLDYYLRVLWKAMAETEACSRIGAMMSECQTNRVETMAEFGRRLGFMSRLADDIEDCLNLKGDLLHRIEYESVPLPILYAAKSSKARFERIKEIIEAPPSPSGAKELLSFCFETEAFDYVRKLARENGKSAKRNLDSLNPSYARNVLSSMIKQSYKRVVDLCI
jgi:geranylgeranyl diphosphate synthase type I